MAPQRWEIVRTPQVDRWLASLSRKQADRVAEAVDALAATGPTLGRDLVDRIKGSRYHNMKELRPTKPGLRILFAFDKQQRAVLLVGGDKSGQWNRWYRGAIPQADRLFEQHQRNSGEVHAWQTRTRAAGQRSAESSR
jgi:hypothetical protein